jgi:putative ribosome biogenesis GTPase RsgA
VTKDEYLGIALSQKIPIIFVINKTDSADCKPMIKTIQDLFNGMIGYNVMPISEKDSFKILKPIAN